MSDERKALAAALQWHLDAGADEALEREPAAKIVPPADIMLRAATMPENSETEAIMQKKASSPKPASSAQEAKAPIEGTQAAVAEARKLAASAQTRDELREAIAAFDGLAVKATATNLVFCDGNPDAPIMLVGEAPGADEDRLGKPFVGQSGQLLDKILKFTGLDRADSDPAKSIYISNILNWRPPGNRTPTPQEVEISLPLIERHIALVKPKLLILAGGVSAKALLETNEGITKLRGRFHAYTPRTPGISDLPPIPVMATYHPAYLLRSPGQKRLVWQDMLVLQRKRREMGLA